MGKTNVVVIEGNLGNDPEVVIFENGDKKIQINLAHTEYRKDKEDITSWFKCDAFGFVANYIEKFVKKGDSITITGRVRIDQWEDKNGEKRSMTKILVDNVSNHSYKKSE